MTHLLKSLALDPKKPLLLTFDAFGTLYKPRAQIGTIYAECARKHGLSGFTDAQIEDNIKQAFKVQRSIAPNYGAGTASSSPYEWWAQVARRTFSEVEMKPGLFDVMFNDLWHEFGSSQAYQLQPGVLEMFGILRRLRVANVKYQLPIFTIGVISNSDPRVSEILESFKIRAPTPKASEVRSTDRRGSKDDCVKTTATGELDLSRDIDFVITSYDVGFEKPANGIFEAARRRAPQLIESDAQHSPDLQCLHIGDDIIEDHDGAINAGWKSILVGPQPVQDIEAGFSYVTGLQEVTALISHIYADSIDR